jgi:enoyl-CoA hydratase
MTNTANAPLPGSVQSGPITSGPITSGPITSGPITSGSVMDPSVIVRIVGRTGRLTLNRPATLNALTFEMVRTLSATLAAWASDPSIELVILDGAGGRALCAGGDVLDLIAKRQDPTRPWRQFWREEYQLNALIHRYPKPYVAIMDGVVMGGGIGISSHARHRIVTDRSMLAMPETGIGLIPDVGGTWLLSHAQGELGTYLGLTGARMSGSDAIQCGFASDYIPASDIEALITRLTEGTGADCAEIIETFADRTSVPSSPLVALRPEIDRLFAFDTVAEIQQALLTSTSELATRARNELARKSPKALILALAAMRQAKHMPTLEAALNMEYRLVLRLYEDGEFAEGVRALLIDKDRAPKWSPATGQSFSLDDQLAYFAAFDGQDELGLRAP